MLTTRTFHALAKPGGSTCNQDCDYCYYLSKGTLAGGPGAGHMSDAVLERFIQQYIAGVTAGARHSSPMRSPRSIGWRPRCDSTHSTLARARPEAVVEQPRYSTQ